MMRMLMWSLLFIIPLSAWSSVTDAYLTVTVHDENGNAVEGVMVQGYFTNLRYDYQPGPERMGLTDDEGVVKISGPALVSVNVEATKEGYYNSEQKVVVNQNKRQSISMLLRLKRNPIPMYAKKTKFQPVILGKEFGYDLMKGDYVAPHGSGETSDLILKINYEKEDFWNYRYNLSIRLSSPNDGLVPFYIEHRESGYKSEYLAPVSGYQNEWEYHQIAIKGQADKTNFDRLRNYYFRIRTVANDKGEVESAYYGKIYGEFPEVTYYLNPTPNDRNVEFDMKNNIFRNLKNEERPRTP